MQTVNAVPSAARQGQGEPLAGPSRRSVWRRPWLTGLLTGAAIAGSAAVSLLVMSIAIRQVLLEDLRTYLRRTAESTAALIDASSHARFSDSAQTNTPEYDALVRPLRILVRTNPDIRFAYSGIVRGDTMHYVLDGDTTSQQAMVMERDVPTDGERQTSRTGTTVVETSPSPTVWGIGIRAYAALSGVTRAPYPYVGITIDAERYNAWLQRVYSAAFKSWLAAAIIAILVGLRTARAERRREGQERDIAAMREAALVSSEQRHVLEQRLQSRQKMEALGTLAGGVAHDFNNLLTIMLGHAELLRDEMEPGTELAESAMAIRTAATRARELVRRILLFARPEAEHRRPVDLVPIIDETVQLLRSTLPASMQLRWTPPAGALVTEADPAQMTQVFMNLAMNARQALADERGTVHLSAEPMTLALDEASRLAVSPGRYICIRVEDDGAGMTDAVRRRVFEPFFTTKAMEQGTGLGLSVVDGVVRGHAGAVDVTSAPGLGSIFTLYLPASDREVDAEPRASDATPAAAQQVISRSRLLLLDDDAAVLRTMSRVLTRAGYTVDTFDDAERAVRALEAIPREYSLLVTDRTMPGMSGLEVARRVHEGDPGLPVVLLSGAIHEGDRESTHFAGVVGKPPDARALVAAIERALTEIRQG
ncbi:MAG: ATP-binding protein [Gemmatimonadota bacterium]